MKRNKYLNLFLNPPDEESGDGEGDENPTAVDILNDETEATDEVVDESEETEIETPPPAFDHKALAAEFGNVLRETIKKGGDDEESETKKPLTDEERDKLLGKLNIDDAFIARLDNIETRGAALKELHDGMVKYADAIGQVRIAQVKKELVEAFRNELNPIVQAHAQQQAEAQMSRFSGTYKQLGNPKLRPLIHSVASQLASAGQTFKTESQMFAAIAKGVEAVIQTHNPGFKLTAASAAKTTSNPNSLPNTSSGAGGGAGKGSGGDKNAGKPLAVRLLS